MPAAGRQNFSIARFTTCIICVPV